MMQVEYVNVNDLKPAEYNPRRMTEEDRKQIRRSLSEFGFMQPVVVNRHADRYNVIVGGHQRVTIAKEDLGISEVPCVFVDLTLQREKELNARLNKNTAHWDNSKLQEFYTFDWLKDIGFLDNELSFWLSDYQKKFNSITNKNCDLPIVPKFSEKYDCVVIISDNSTDTSFLKTALGIQKCQSYKNTRTGEGMIITVEQLRRALHGGED